MKKEQYSLYGYNLKQLQGRMYEVNTIGGGMALRVDINFGSRVIHFTVVSSTPNEFMELTSGRRSFRLVKKAASKQEVKKLYLWLPTKILRMFTNELCELWVADDTDKVGLRFTYMMDGFRPDNNYAGHVNEPDAFRGAHEQWSI